MVMVHALAAAPDVPVFAFGTGDAPAGTQGSDVTHAPAIPAHITPLAETAANPLFHPNAAAAR